MLIVVGRRRLPRRQERQGRHHRRHLAAVSAADGRRRRRGDRRLRQDRQEAADRGKTSSTPACSSITDQPVAGVPSITTDEGAEALLGLISPRSELNAVTGSALASFGLRAPTSRRRSRHEKRARSGMSEAIAGGGRRRRSSRSVLGAAATRRRRSRRSSSRSLQRAPALPASPIRPLVPLIVLLLGLAARRHRQLLALRHRQQSVDRPDRR